MADEALEAPIFVAIEADPKEPDKVSSVPQHKVRGLKEPYRASSVPQHKARDLREADQPHRVSSVPRLRASVLREAERSRPDRIPDGRLKILWRMTRTTLNLNS